MALTGSYLQAAILWMGAKLKTLFVICGHDSFDVFQGIRAELRVSQEIFHKQVAIYEDKKVVLVTFPQWILSHLLTSLS